MQENSMQSRVSNGQAQNPTEELTPEDRQMDLHKWTAVITYGHHLNFETGVQILLGKILFGLYPLGKSSSVEGNEAFFQQIAVESFHPFNL